MSVFGNANCVQIFLEMSTNICPQLNRGHHNCKQAAEHSSSITRLSTHSLCFEPLVVLAQQQCWHWQTYNVYKVQMIWDRNLFKILPKAQHTSDLIVSAISTNEKSAHFHFTGEQITKVANKIELLVARNCDDQFVRLFSIVLFNIIFTTDSCLEAKTSNRQVFIKHDIIESTKNKVIFFANSRNDENFGVLISWNKIYIISIPRSS